VHQDQVTRTAQAQKSVGRIQRFLRIAALLYALIEIWTIQPHPSFTQDFIDGLSRTLRQGVVPDHQLESASRPVGAPTDNAKNRRPTLQTSFKKERL